MKKLFFIVIAAIFLIAMTPTLKAQVNKQDSLILVNIHDSLGGKHFGVPGWLTNAPVSTWIGVRVNANNRVDSINIGSYNLRGSLPLSIGNLTYLRYLNMEAGNISGTIPTTLGNLNNLHYLNLGGNQFTGSIPSSLGNLTNLDTLDLRFNQLNDSIPSSLGNLTNLKYLDLDYNELTGSIPSSLGNLTTLQILSLYLNQLSGSIPISLGNLTKLDTMWLDHNQLSGSMPTSFGSLTHLTSLTLNNNKLSGIIPSSLQNLTNLKVGHIINNQFTFAGMEAIAKNNAFINEYAPQATVPLQQNGNTFSVSVGGTPANNTFKWYRNDTLVATKVADSTYIFTSNGKYWVVATNSVATQLTLYSDTITIAGLPIKDITLSAKETNGQVLLQWQTTDEVNTASFTIQRSTDGKTFTDLATKEAIGKGDNGYSYMDASAASGVNYYRIKVTDKTGVITYSNVASLTINHSLLTIYPNPAKDVATIQGNHIASVQVIDNMGRVVKVFLLNDATNPKLIVSNLPSGLYHLRIQTAHCNVSEIGMVKE